MVLHETLYLYLFRKIIKKVKGTLVIENFKIFILLDLMKNRQITKKQAFVICLLPPIICTVVGFLILGIISYGLKFFTLTKIIYIFISISWLVNILSIFPFSPDFKTWKMYCNNIDKKVKKNIEVLGRGIMNNKLSKKHVGRVFTQSSIIAFVIYPISIIFLSFVYLFQNKSFNFMGFSVNPIVDIDSASVSVSVSPMFLVSILLVFILITIISYLKERGIRNGE
ncbi:hypothetical protein AOC36_05935 [Erysipelothrix larvae]|uniref:Uncharacterized protein n=2 Tax=Erysipelothrix larvae TaxID=1514105 RepID=A0A0X8GZY6_9FIRM|nr:hypothetical protein AOC36_05935 [Erysipelothrix larvae]